MILVLAGVAFAQVDTMRLLEVGSVTAPGPITNWYFEDLNGDSIKEIILTTANSVNIYSGSSFSPIWSQDGFINPKDLNFADINNDGLIDFSVKDTSHIYLIDPHHSTTIWTSPLLDSLYKCYTIGDRNGDSIIDVAIVTEEPFGWIPEIPDTDTVWINTYDGPDFNNLTSYYSYVINFAGHDGMGHGYNNLESSAKIEICNITCDWQIETRIILFTNQNNAGSAHGGYSWEGHSGGLRIINPTQTTSNNFNNSIGYIIDGGVYSSGTERKFIAFCGQTNKSSIPYTYSVQNTFSSITIENDTCLEIDTIWNHLRISGPYNPIDSLFWIGYLIGDLNDLGGNEIFFGDTDSLCLKYYPSLNPIWSVGSEYSSLNQEIIGKFRGDFGSSQDLNWIVIKISSSINPQYQKKYIFISSRNGQLHVLSLSNIDLQGIFAEPFQPRDYFCSIINATIYFYSVVPNVDINNSSPIFSSFFLAPNYPNPFNASTMIEYGLPEPGPVKVEIFDILGRKIQTLIDETQSAGYHRVIWNGEDSPSGTYFYRIQAGEKSQTKKCLLLK